MVPCASARKPTGTRKTQTFQQIMSHAAGELRRAVKVKAAKATVRGAGSR
jgi:hypothetical protein